MGPPEPNPRWSGIACKFPDHRANLPKKGTTVNPAALIIGWAIVFGIFLGLLSAMVMAFLAGWNLAGTALGLVALILVGWAGGELR